MDDSLIFEAAETEDQPLGFYWAVNSAEVYPGWKYVADSERALAWSRKMGQSMHEVMIETNVYKLSLVFNSLAVESIRRA